MDAELTRPLGVFCNEEMRHTFFHLNNVGFSLIWTMSGSLPWVYSHKNKRSRQQRSGNLNKGFREDLVLRLQVNYPLNGLDLVETFVVP